MAFNITSFDAAISMVVFQREGTEQGPVCTITDELAKAILEAVKHMPLTQERRDKIADTLKKVQIFTPRVTVAEAEAADRAGNPRAYDLMIESHGDMIAWEIASALQRFNTAVQKCKSFERQSFAMMAEKVLEALHKLLKSEAPIIDKVSLDKAVQTIFGPEESGGINLLFSDEGISLADFEEVLNKARYELASTSYDTEITCEDFERKVDLLIGDNEAMRGKQPDILAYLLANTRKDSKVLENLLKAADLGGHRMVSEILRSKVESSQASSE